MLAISNLSFSIGGSLLFDKTSIFVNEGDKVGLVGRNGSGKTTLFKILLNELDPDQGEIKVRKKVRVSAVSQDAPAGNISLIDFVVAADMQRSELLARAEISNNPDEIAYIQNKLTEIDAHSAESRGAKILAGLGFSENNQQKELDNFSGGWRMRVALAATLFSKPDILLLDEPTNHLDLEATLWLESYLASWSGTLLLISHDRSILNSSVSQIIQIERLKLVCYQGNYDNFERIRRDKLLLNTKLRKKQLLERQRIETFIDRFRFKARKAKQAQSRIKMLERMDPLPELTEDASLKLKFPEPERLSPPLLTLDNIDAGYQDDTLILKQLNLRIDSDDRIGLLGANGNGKSTLMKLLSGRLKPKGGNIQKSSKLRIGYFAQHQSDELKMNETPYNHISPNMSSAPESKIRAHLGRFGFFGEKVNVKCANLSGGEKSKLLFALMSLEAPHILLLDEPTNHLDVESREALIHALTVFDGAVIIVSHDRHLLSLVCDRLWLVEGGTCVSFDGDLNSYRSYQLEARRAEKRSKRKNHNPVNLEINRKHLRRSRALKRAELSDVKKLIKNLEKKIEVLGIKRKEVEESLASPQLYEGPRDAHLDLQAQYVEVKKDIEDLEAKWLEASTLVAESSNQTAERR